MVNRGIRAVALSAIVSLCLAAFAPLAQAAGRVTVSAPRRAKGDGKSRTTVSIKIRPSRLVNQATVTAQVDAGTITVGKAATDGEWRATFVAPVVAKTTRVEIRVQAVVRKKTLTAKRTIRVDPQLRAADAIRSGGALDLRVEPGALILGRDSSAKITFRPPEGERPRVFVNVGRISDVEPAGKGLYKATYFPPEKLFPQAAIIAVLAGESTPIFDWAALPLLGMGTFQTEVAPKARVSIQVGARVFGPFVAGADGQLAAPIIAPPGVPVGSTIVNGAKEQDVDLGVPSFNRLLAACPNSADRILVFVLNSSGEPADGERLDAEANVGGVGNVVQKAPGIYEGRYAAPRDAKLGSQATLTAKLPGIASATCELTIRAAGASRITAKPAVAVYKAGTRSPIALDVQAFDLAGRPASDVPLRFEPELGEVEVPVQSGPGVYTAVWRLPDNFQGKRQAFVDVIAGRGDETVRVETSVALQPARMVSVTARLERDTLPADGRSSTDLIVQFLDTYGNASNAVEIVAESDGKIGEFTYVESERAMVARYTAPTRFSDSADTVYVRAKGSDTKARIPVQLRSARLVLMGVQGGYSTNLGKVSTPFATIDSLVPVSHWLEGLMIGGNVGIGYRNQTLAAEIVGGGPGVPTQVNTQVRVWWAPLMLRIAYDYSVYPFGFYVAVDGGGALLGQETNSELSGRTATVSVVPVFGGAVGASYGAGPGRFVFEVDYRNARSNSRSVHGNVAGIAVLAGYRFELGI